MRQYNRNGVGGSLSPRSLASALPQGPPYSLVNNGSAHTREAYRDLLVFEERLKQNSERLASQRRKYEAFLLSLILSIFILSYNTFISPSSYTIIQFLNSGLLLIGIVTLILFFATGVYSEKIAYAYKFVPQANRALRYFNIYLNTKKQPRQWSSYYNPLNLFRISSLSSGTSSPGLSRVPSPASTSGTTRTSRSRSPSTTSSTFSSSGASSSSSPSSPTSSRQAIQLNPLPPSSNPRGELIFSSKVSTAYREGYEKYRSDWEKRRRVEKARREREENNMGVRWLVSFLVPGSWLRSRGEMERSAGNKEEDTAATATATVMAMEEKKKRKMEKRTSVPYAATPSEYSDSSSVDHHHPPPSSVQSQSRNGEIAPSAAASSRGRDSTARPLVRSTSSTSSIASSSSLVSNSPPISRRSSPLRSGVAIPITSSSRSSPVRMNLNLNTALPSSNGSSRATTPDLIPEDDEKEQEEYMSYRPTNGGERGAHSPSSISIASTSSISIAASSQQSLLFSGSGSGSGSNRRRQYMPSVTSDDSLLSNASSIEGQMRKSRRSHEEDGTYDDDDDDDDDALRSPLDMSPPAKEAALRELPAGEAKRRSRASSFNEFLAELREDGM